MDKKELFAFIVKHFGGQRSMARALLVTDGAISQWVSAQAIPPLQAIKIEKMMNGSVKAADLIK